MSTLLDSAATLDPVRRADLALNDTLWRPTMHTITTDLELSICGFDCAQEVTLCYTYDPACGDGWNEPRLSASVELASARVSYGAGYDYIDVYPLLSAKCRQELEAWLVGEHEEGMKPDPDYLRDLREVA